MTTIRYHVGRQPCYNYKPEELPPTMWPAYECPVCWKSHWFCLNCYQDHHEDGWETCDKGERHDRNGDVCDRSGTPI